MTDTDNTTPCPSYGWCDSFDPEFASAHEHYRATGYVPATLSPGHIDVNGASFPSAGVGISYSEGNDPTPGVFVHLSGPGQDSDILMRVDEAIEVRRALDAAIALLIDTVNPRLLTRDEERVRAEAEVREAL